MGKSVTVVYYSGYYNEPDAFYVSIVDGETLQSAFYDHDIRSIKHITIGDESQVDKNFRTLFTESDIQSFLDFWKIDF